MGGAVSAGEDNDELIDNLVVGEYIKSFAVEKVFRAVDRGNYFLDQCRENAYRDLAWKYDKIHISAPCIYSEVMEALKLGPGMSFLNLGSGTGYLSTMAGLMLGPYGTNHGIELYESNVIYAQEILEEFLVCSPALDKYEFCAPAFVSGNCLLLDSPQYDRVYCGASCPTEHENFIKNLVRVGGILVMPINDNLLQVTRTSETTFDVRNVLPVSFASLVVPNSTEELLSVKLPEKQPIFLQEICRSSIRILLRKIVELENPTIITKRVIRHKRKRGKRHFRRIIIPFVEDSRSPRAEEGMGEDHVPGQEDKEDEPRLVLEDADHDPEMALWNPTPSQENQLAQVGCEPYMFNQDEDMLEEISVCKRERRRTLTANGDSGIDNISDDSFPEEECPSDAEFEVECGLSEHGNEVLSIKDDSGSHSFIRETPCSSSQIGFFDSILGAATSSGSNNNGRPANSNYLKRSIEENEEEGDSPGAEEDEDDVHRKRPHCTGSSSAVIFKRVAFSDPDSDELEEIESDDSESEKLPRYDEKNNLSKYTHFMKEKINQLPIPQPLKVYLNLSRPLS